MQARMIWGFAGIALLNVIGSSCSDDPLRTTAVNGGPVLPATTLVAISSTTGTAVVGSLINDLPTVMAQDANGNPVPNTSVTFSQTTGSGVVTGGVVMTNAAGLASPASWTLSKTAGLNTVSTATGSIRGPIFNRVGVPGPAANVRKTAGDDQIAASRTVTVVDPTLQVVDVYGNGIEGVTANFSVGVGGGTIGNSTAVTDSLGRASVRWTLGDSGAQSLIASVADLSTVTFTAVAVDISASCGSSTALIPSTTEVSGLTSQSCMTADGRAFETFPVSLSTGTYSFKLNSNDFDTEIEIRDENMNLVATNNDASITGTNSAIKIVAATGLYTVIARSHVPGKTGVFDLSFAPVAAQVSGCEEAYATRSIASDQTVKPEDCSRSLYERENRFRIFVKAGDSLFVRIDDRSYSEPGLELTDLDRRVVSTGKQGAAYDKELTFTPADDGFYVIVISAWAYDVAKVVLTTK